MVTYIEISMKLGLINQTKKFVLGPNRGKQLGLEH